MSLCNKRCPLSREGMLNCCSSSTDVDHVYTLKKCESRCALSKQQCVPKGDFLMVF